MNTAGTIELEVSTGDEHGVLRIDRSDATAALWYVGSDNDKSYQIVTTKLRPLTVLGDRLWVRGRGGATFVAANPDDAIGFARALPTNIITDITERSSSASIDTARLDSPDAAAGAWARTYNVARTVGVLSWVLAIAGAIIGFLIALQRDPLCAVSFSECSILDTYPDLIGGLVIGFVAVFQALIVVMIANYVSSRARHAVVSLHSSIDT